MLRALVELSPEFIYYLIALFFCKTIRETCFWEKENIV